MSRLVSRLRDRADVIVAGLLALGYLVGLVATAGTLGFTRDEGFYFTAARAYAEWLELLTRQPLQALSRASIDHYWVVNHEHPSLLKLLFALSNRSLGGAFADVSLSFRFPAMLLSSACVGLVYAWARRYAGRAAALVAALSFAGLPRLFFHAHLACFDVPVAALWLATSYAYVRALTAQSVRWSLAAGVAYGLLLDTKHNSWIFPFVVLAHFMLTRLVARSSAGQVPAPRWPWRTWSALALIGPLLFVLLWPWLWHDTYSRVREYVAFHTGHEYYNMEFLGRTYWKPPMPRAYAWVMTFATVPLVTLALGLAGAARLLQPEDRAGERGSAQLFWAVSIAASYAPWLSSATPIFGGTKHWLSAYPFLCLFAGLGFERVMQALVTLAPRWARPVPVAASVLVGPACMTWHAHPFGLSAYTPLVGGAPGAASLGLNRGFWGYTTQSLLPFIERRLPRRGTIYLHDTAPASFAMFQAAGRLRRDAKGSLDIAASDIALYHHEPHMSRVEQQIWLDYATVAPDALLSFDGVPIAWAYARANRGSR